MVHCLIHCFRDFMASFLPGFMGFMGFVISWNLWFGGFSGFIGFVKFHGLRCSTGFAVSLVS